MEEQIVLNTTLFGTLTFDSEKGLCEDYTIHICGKEISTTLLLWEDFITTENQEAVLALLENIPVMYQRARTEIENSFESNACIRYFIQCHVEDLEENCLLEYFEVEDLEEITPQLFIQKLGPRTICIAPTGDGTERDCTFDFSIDETISDELLVIRFNQLLEIDHITHES